MDLAAEPTPSAPLLAVQHAARALRVGGVVRLMADAAASDALAAEAMVDGRETLQPELPPGSLLALTGERMRSLGLPSDPNQIYLLLLARSDLVPGRLAALVDPTAQDGSVIDVLALAQPTERDDARAAIDLCKLAGLLPAAILMPAAPTAAELVQVAIDDVAGYRRLAASSLRIFRCSATVTAHRRSHAARTRGAFSTRRASLASPCR